MDLQSLIKYGKIIIFIIMMTTMILPALAATTMKIYPSDDAHVRDYSSTIKNTNYGGEQDLGVGFNGASKGKYRSYIMFNLTNLTGKTVNSAKISFEPNNNQNNPTIKIYLSSTNWDEDSVTWNYQPSYSILIGSKPILNLDRVSIDVTSQISGNKVSFALIEEGENQYAQFFSKDYATTHNITEDSTRWPYLEVTYEDGTSCNTQADTNCDGQVSLNEYSMFKYNFKNGLLPGVTLTEYSTIKYEFKNGLLN